MIAPNPKSLCQQAEPYYYDFLCTETQEIVPEPIINHIQHCTSCQKQINQLQAVLSQAKSQVEPESKQVSSATTEMLKFHFAYIGRPVTCEVVRPFLPILSDPALEVRIPTPITVHLDNCQRCSEKLKAIRSLHLNRIQLWRLSQLFADKDTRHGISCIQAHAAILEVLTMSFRETNTEVLKHLCMCPYCRKLLYQYREAMCNELQKKKINQKFPCQEVSESDIFDYVVPYGLDLAKDQYAKFRVFLTSHLQTCPMCLSKMQQLHNTIYAIAKRPESDVVTIYNIDESAKVKTVGESDNLYAGFPIRVKVTGCKDKAEAEQPASTVDFGTAMKQKVSARKLKPLLKPAVAVAAVILIAVALFLNVPTANAVTLERIYKAIEKVKNVYIASFVPGRKEPIQEQWVSRTLEVQLIKTEKELVLWDSPNRVKKVKHLDSGLVETETLSVEMTDAIEKMIAGSLGLVPFTDLSLVPKDAKWSRVADDNLEAVSEGIEVYDLTWLEKASDGSNVFRKWRVFVDAEAYLPQKTEFYEKLPTDINYNLRSEKVVEYLSDSEMQKVIKESTFLGQ